ncbi:Uncharacterized protein DBV15_03897, partial [Temnothorax longispinosus]
CRIFPQSQFPVFTIYAQKSCLAVKPCERAWCIDRVQGHRLQGHARRTMTASSRQHCLELCLGERDFLCRCEEHRGIQAVFFIDQVCGRRRHGRVGARLPISIELGVARLCGITPTRQGFAVREASVPGECARAHLESLVPPKRKVSASWSPRQRPPELYLRLRPRDRVERSSGQAETVSKVAKAPRVSRPPVFEETVEKRAPG